jgi:hypothetical protein
MGSVPCWNEKHPSMGDQRVLTQFQKAKWNLQYQWWSRREATIKEEWNKNTNRRSSNQSSPSNVPSSPRIPRPSLKQLDLTCPKDIHLDEFRLPSSTRPTNRRTLMRKCSMFQYWRILTLSCHNKQMLVLLDDNGRRADGPPKKATTPAKPLQNDKEALEEATWWD